MKECVNIVRQSEAVQVSLIPYKDGKQVFSPDEIIYDLERELDLLSSHADTLDYLVSIASGLLCGMIDILWTGNFDLWRNKALANQDVERMVQKVAKMRGCKGDDLKSCVSFLEKMAPIPSDKCTPMFGGGLQHHLRDFAHHPTVVGLIFSLLTQFTEKSYGTDTAGRFMIVDVPEEGLALIGKDVPTKFFYGTILWFFHLVSDIAGSSSSIQPGACAGTGIPGPVLSLAKELSVLPFFRSIKVGKINLTLLLSKLFNGTLFAQRDQNNRILKNTVVRFDFRAELGVANGLVRQRVPVVANDCIVRTFYMIRRLAMGIRENQVRTLDDFRKLDWEQIKPGKNPTLSRMLLISSGVFSALDIGEAVVSQKYFVAVNYVGVGRFAVAIGDDISWRVKARDIRSTTDMYKTIKRNTFQKEDQRIYKRISADLNMDRLSLTAAQAEILYNLEYQVVLNDIALTNGFMSAESAALKRDWLAEWKHYIEEGFSQFTQSKYARIHWYSPNELMREIGRHKPTQVWFRLVLLETVLFTPYYALTLETGNHGFPVPSKKYSRLETSANGFNRTRAIHFLDSFCGNSYCHAGYCTRLLECYETVYQELYLKPKLAMIYELVTTVAALAELLNNNHSVLAIFATLVGTDFKKNPASSPVLAFWGSGTVSSSCFTSPGTLPVMVAGSSLLMLSKFSDEGSAAHAAAWTGEKNAIAQSAKLITALREIFIQDEHDTEYSNQLYERYVQNITEIEQGITKLDLQIRRTSGEEQKALKLMRREAEKTAIAMKRSRQSILNEVRH